MKLYLASGSPRRREILDLMHLPYEICTADADETLPAGTAMEAAGRLLASRKAEAAAARLAAAMPTDGDALILAADTLVYLDGKPYTAADVTAVTMRAYGEDEARAYVATGEPLDKAGAYGIQGIGSVLVEKIDGDFFTVMGLSPRVVRGLLGDAGYTYFDLI